MQGQRKATDGTRKWQYLWSIWQGHSFLCDIFKNCIRFFIFFSATVSLCFDKSSLFWRKCSLTAVLCSFWWLLAKLQFFCKKIIIETKSGNHQPVMEVKEVLRPRPRPWLSRQRTSVKVKAWCKDKDKHITGIIRNRFTCKDYVEHSAWWQQ